MRDEKRVARLTVQLREAMGSPYGATVASPSDAWELLRDMEPLLQEQLRVLVLNTRNKVLDVATVYQGSVNTAVVRMAEIFRPAILCNAPAVILAHNHPSGDPEPSEADIAMSKLVGEAGKLLEVQVLDHIIIGLNCWVSLKARGHL